VAEVNIQDLGWLPGAASGRAKARIGLAMVKGD
jgi:hypothetical protein